MILYTCAAQKHGATGPLIKHPCGVAAKALDDAGQPYEIKVVAGFKNCRAAVAEIGKTSSSSPANKMSRYLCSTTTQLSPAQQPSRPGRKDTSGGFRPDKRVLPLAPELRDAHLP